MLPNVARYQLRYTPIVIKLWSCKWSNLWSNTFLTAIFCFPYRPKIARLKGFRRLLPTNGVNTVYAPKCGAPFPTLSGVLISIVSICFENDCGMKCGRKKLPEQRNLLGEFAAAGMLTLYPQKVKSFCPQNLSRSRQRNTRTRE